MKRSLNIAIHGKGFLWGGGVELLRNFANALLSDENQFSIKLFLLLPVRNRIDTFIDVLGLAKNISVNVVTRKKIYPLRTEALYDPSIPDYFSNIDGSVQIVLYNDDTGLISALSRIRADVILPALHSLGDAFPFPWIGYIYDFQHRYYPQYFSATEYLDREICFATTLRDAKVVIVNSQSVADDIMRFFPHNNCKIFALPFSASPVLNWLDDDTEILNRYFLPSKFFLISNQFWLHKSHITAFKALSKIVKDKHASDVHIVCTGKMDDYRFPGYVESLKEELSEMGIGDRVHFLGHIPKIDQINIMKKCVAVLQPTLFEGGPGGGSVYDAVCLGVPAVVSDIPVNQELHERNVIFFRTGSSEDMALKMNKMLEMSPDRPSKEVLISEGQRRKQLVGERLVEAIRFVREKYR